MSVSSMINGPEKFMTRSRWMTRAKSTVPSPIVRCWSMVPSCQRVALLEFGQQRFDKPRDSAGKKVAMGHVESQPQVRRSDAAKEVGELLRRHPEVLELRVHRQTVHILDHQGNTLSFGVFYCAAKGLAQRGPYPLEIDAEVEPAVDDQVLAPQPSCEINVLFQVLRGGLPDRRHDLRTVDEGGGVEAHRISERPMRRRTRRILSRSKVWGKFAGFWQPNSSQETWCRRARGK